MQRILGTLGILVAGAVVGAVLLTVVAAYMLFQSLGNPTISNEHTLIFFGVAFASGAAVSGVWRLLASSARRRQAFAELRTPFSSGAPEPTNAGEGHAELQILEALERHGELSPAKAAIKTALAIDEADQLLSNLAQRGHLEVRVQDGKLFYKM